VATREGAKIPVNVYFTMDKEEKKQFAQQETRFGDGDNGTAADWTPGRKGLSSSELDMNSLGKSNTTDQQHAGDANFNSFNARNTSFRKMPPVKRKKGSVQMVNVKRSAQKPRQTPTPVIKKQALLVGAGGGQHNAFGQITIAKTNGNKFISTKKRSVSTISNTHGDAVY